MQLPIRNAVLSSPDYPFLPIEAPVKLDQNESTEGFPSALKTTVLEQLANMPWHRYPELNSEMLCQAIANQDGWESSGVVVATGSNVLIALIIQLAALEGRVLTVKPNFALYGLDAKLLGSALTEVPLRDDFSIDIDDVISTLDEQEDRSTSPAGVIYISQPHAPTGSFASMNELERLANASKRWLLVIDEAYHQFSETDASGFAKRFSHVVLLRTFSKAWGLAGLRLGYALASGEVARNLRKLVPPFAVSVMQSVTAQVALSNRNICRSESTGRFKNGNA